MLLMTRNDGWHTLSKIPSKVLTVTRPAKLWQAACSASMVPQPMIAVLNSLAIGSLAMSWAMSAKIRGAERANPLLY